MSASWSFRTLRFLSQSVGAATVAAALVTTPPEYAAAQQSPDGATGSAPVTLEQLPAGPLRSDIERLSPTVRQRAIESINRSGIPKADLNYLRVDQDGMLLYVDPPPEIPKKQGMTGPKAKKAIINIDPADVFELSSRPGASRTVYLNFRGENVTGKAWNNSSGRPSHPMRPYSQDGNRNNVNQAEANLIAEVWKIMAEDYAPFDINVTTERPGAFGPNVGMVLFADQTDANGYNIYNCSCGGVAYVSVWGQSYFTTYQPALVFTSAFGADAKALAEAGSHELGHNLGLSHDGTGSVGYYTGHGSGNVSWAPIMGVGYYRNISQFSKGEYPGASNTQDDLAIIAGKLGYIPDDHGNTAGGASALSITDGVVRSESLVTSPFSPDSGSNRGIISAPGDIDMFYFDAAIAATVTLNIHPEWRDDFLPQDLRSGNLDVRATLIRSDTGTVIAHSSLESETHASISAGVTAGRYLLRVEGVGSGTVSSGYSDYGSRGRYFISGTVPDTTSHTIDVFASPEGAGTVSGGRSYPAGASATVIARATRGTEFVDWTEGSRSVSRSAKYTFTVRGDRALVANFKTPDPLLTVAPRSVSFSGAVGGPFVPRSQTLKISVSNGRANWKLSGVPSWLKAPKTGSASTTPRDLVLRLTADARRLKRTQKATLVFRNMSASQPLIRTTVTLKLKKSRSKEAEPVAGLQLSGLE